jgi:ABC-type multidrug transport system ATPase subunit
MLRVAGLTKHYGLLAALDDVSFSIRPGEILGLIGPNGAGRTTLFECMAAVLPPTAGNVLLDGRPITSRERSGALFYLPDAIAPWPAQPVRWALDFTIAFFDGRRDLLGDVIESLDLTPLLPLATGTLSKGQRKGTTPCCALLSQARSDSGRRRTVPVTSRITSSVRSRSQC